ncbi:MAG: alpha/beta fold hydrolase [Verrucomicrobiales bacterium]|nr:lysophospholipase [bacterium]MDF2376654.1 alpha/beta fold hydrolase [Verrucomicrobiales bacterium]
MSESQGIERRFELEWMDRTVHTVQYPAVSSTRGTVLILHGLGDHVGRYVWAIELFHNQGFDVLGIDWPGCGQSSGIRGDLPVLDEACRMVEEVLEALEVVPVGVLGHSTGGFFLTHFLARSLPVFSSVKWAWFSSPLLDPSHGQSVLKIAAAKLLVKVLPKFTLSTGVYPRDCFHTGGGPRSRDFAEGVHNRISLRFGEDLLDPEKVAVKVAGRIDENISILVTQGAADHVCAPEVAEPFVQELKIQDKAFLFVRGARHEPFREPDSFAFLNQVRAWLARR